jgi:acetyl esterase/lipase
MAEPSCVASVRRPFPSRALSVARLLAFGACLLGASASAQAPPATKRPQFRPTVRRDFDIVKESGVAKTLLWEKGAPLAQGNGPGDQPGIHVFPPKAGTANGTGCVICPGGGYGFLAMDHEGWQVAKWLNERGVTAFVLQYRLAPRYHHPCPLLDVQRAVRLVRHRAREYGVNPERVGVWGFSAGGHLTSTIGVKHDTGKADAEDPIDRQSCRPSFLVLGYPVITFEGPAAHRGSRNNLFGSTNADLKFDAEFSNHRHVSKSTPPTFLFHTAEDTAVPPENALLWFRACHQNGVPCELHLYEKGVHGVGLAPGDRILGKWPDRLADWLEDRGLIKS